MSKIMTRQEFINSQEYADMITKVKGYSTGFEFNIPYYKMTSAQRNAMEIVVRDCVESGIIESVAVSLDLDGKVTEEKFKRI